MSFSKKKKKKGKPLEITNQKKKKGKTFREHY